MREVVRNITKYEAAQRQTDTAISLLFRNEDAISIHVLASSASVILQDVCKHKGVQSLLEMGREFIAEDRRVEFFRKLKEAYNYFKHADRDPFADLEGFDQSSNEEVLFACCYDYGMAYGLLTMPMSIYQFWYIAAHPKTVTDEFPYTKVMQSQFDSLHLKQQEEQRRLGKECLIRIYREDNRPLGLLGA